MPVLVPVLVLVQGSEAGLALSLASPRSLI
jgi:hypothetical protein